MSTPNHPEENEDLPIDASADSELSDEPAAHTSTSFTGKSKSGPNTVPEGGN